MKNKYIVYNFDKNKEINNLVHKKIEQHNTSVKILLENPEELKMQLRKVVGYYEN